MKAVIGIILLLLFIAVIYFILRFISKILIRIITAAWPDKKPNEETHIHYTQVNNNLTIVDKKELK